MWSVNLKLDQALLGSGNSHIRVIEITSFQTEDFMNHGLHLNSWVKKKLTLLIAKSVGDKNVSCTNSIPVITSETASPVLVSKQKHKGA